MQRRRLASSFENLNSSPAQLHGKLELQSGTKTVAQCGISMYEYIIHQRQKC